LIKKNNARFQFFSPKNPEYAKLLIKTADAIAQARAAPGPPVVEVNTGGIIRAYTTEPYPSLDILRILKERDIPLVVNADAHVPEHLGGGYETAWETMRQAGYGSAAVFQGRKDGMAVWRS
jgi:histidinol-phosphatase (PHP family)